METIKPVLRERFNVQTKAFFDSYIRGEQSEGSHLGVLEEFSEPVGLFKYIELEDLLSAELDVKADLVMRDALKPRIRERILEEAI